jgi:CHAD domain-containing protein
MAYRFKRKESVPNGVHRILVEQAKKAADELGGGNPDIHEGVHNARKAFKKERGLLRLARYDLEKGVYKELNAWFRDAKNRLASARDAEAMIETFDQLAERYPSISESESLRAVRESLVERREAITSDDEALTQTAHELSRELADFSDRTKQWEFSRGGFDGLARGLERVYRQGREAMKKAYQDPSDERFHDWRKRVKDYWYHSRLLRNVWPEMMKPLVDELKQLSDLLGDDHDLAVLQATLAADRDKLQGDIDTLACLASKRQGELRSEAKALGARLYAEKPGCLVDTLGGHWKAWKKRKRPM